MDRPTRQNAMRKGSACTLVYEAPAEDTNGKPKISQIMWFMSPKQNWMKEGLLEHIIELVVAEDKLNAYISGP